MSDTPDGPLAPEGFDPLALEILKKRVKMLEQRGTAFVLITATPPNKAIFGEFKVTYVGTGNIGEMIDEARRLKSFIKDKKSRGEL